MTSGKELRRSRPFGWLQRCRFRSVTVQRMHLRHCLRPIGLSVACLPASYSFVAHGWSLGACVCLQSSCPYLSLSLWSGNLRVCVRVCVARLCVQVFECQGDFLQRCLKQQLLLPEVSISFADAHLCPVQSSQYRLVCQASPAFSRSKSCVLANFPAKVPHHYLQILVLANFPAQVYHPRTVFRCIV